MPEPFRAAPLGPKIEAGLVRIYRGRAWFETYWRPLRNFGLDMRPDGSAKVVEPVLRRTQIEALTAAAVLAGTTVVERCADLADHLARAMLDEPLPDPRRTVRPILSPTQARDMIRRLFTEEPEKPGSPHLTVRLGAGAAAFVERIEPDRDRREVRGLAIANAAHDLAHDQFPLISKVYGGGPQSEEIGTLIRHCVAHPRDLGDELDQHRHLFAGFATAMELVFGRLQWLLVANSTGAACSEWYDRRRGTELVSAAP